MQKDSHKAICGRIAKLRLETAGPRGKSKFAKALGLSASTYDYYEATRVPPAEVLVRIAEMTGADLRWLLTGEESHEAVGADEHPAVRRAAAMLGDSPDAAGPLAAFLDILAEARRFPGKGAGEAAAAEARRPAAGADGAASGERDEGRAMAGERAEGRATAETAAGSSPSGRSAKRQAAIETAVTGDGLGGGRPEAWIPVLGRSAAGIAHFWASGREAAGLTTLDDLVARQPLAAARTVRPATATAGEGGEESPVQIITLSAPDAGDVVEFVSAPQLRARHGEAFALRIDGDSMAPDIRHGDLVVVSPSLPAADGRAAVVQLAGQIGVTCKLYRRAGDAVHLVPINDRYEIATCPAGEVVWALRVLARVRS